MFVMQARIAGDGVVRGKVFGEGNLLLFSQAVVALDRTVAALPNLLGPRFGRPPRISAPPAKVLGWSKSTCAKCHGFAQSLDVYKETIPNSFHSCLVSPSKSHRCTKIW